jgi:PTS system nitrogen regulatory IIA component
MAMEVEKDHMELGDLISPEAVIPALAARYKKQVLQELAQRAAELTKLNAADIFETLLQRERLGSTAVGRGIAIPHGQIAGIQRIVSVFARLQPAIDFDAPDEEPVDLVFLLLAPEQAGADHLKALARVSRLLRQPQSIEMLRAANDRATLYAILTEPAAVAAA